MEEKTYRIEKCDGKVQWDEFILEAGGHPMQLWGWGDVRATLGWQVDRLFIVEDDVQIGAVQLLIKRLPRPFSLCVYIPRGPVIVTNESAVYDQLIRYVKETYRGVALIIEPNEEGEPSGVGWRESELHALAPRTIALDLHKAAGILLAEMDQNTRDHIRTAGEANLTIKKLGNPEDITACYQVYRETVIRRGDKPYREKYFHDLHDKLGEFSIIFGAYRENELVSFQWLAVSEAVAIELYGGVTTKGLEVAADYCLRWEAIRRTKQWGIKTYDIGGVDAQNETDVKRGFGNQFLNRGTFVLPLSPLYSIWKRAGRNRSSYAK